MQRSIVTTSRHSALRFDKIQIWTYSYRSSRTSSSITGAHIAVDCCRLIHPMSRSNAYLRHSTVSRALIERWIALYGIRTITNDRGPIFESSLFASLAKLLVATSQHTTAYHPQDNGIVERFHRHPMSALRSQKSQTN